MAVNVNFSSVFNNALPMAYIRNVSLLDGDIGQLRASADEKSQAKVTKKNIFGKKEVSAAKKRESILNAGKNLTVEVELSLKDGITSAGTSTWLEDETMQKYLNLRVLLCLDEGVGRRIRNGDLRRKEIESLVHEGLIIEQTVSLFGGNKKGIREFRTESIGGKTAYSVPYTISFTVNNYRPKYLAVFAMTVLETGRASSDKQAFNSRTRSEIQGNTTGEILISRGSLKKRASVFTDPEGAIWAGPVHSHEGEYMAGAFHSSRAHDTLTETKVQNIVVSDFRLLEDAMKAELQLYPDKAEELETKRKGNKRDKTSGGNKIIRKESFLSQLYDSRGQSNTSNFVFHFDFDKLIRLRGQYGKILEIVDDTAKANILSKSRIRNVRIMRHRVVNGLRKNEYKDASFEERSELVAMSSEELSGFLPLSVRESHPDATTTEADPKLIGAIKEIQVSDTQLIRTFSVSDYDMANRTDGLYQYSVQFDIEDGTVFFVSEQLKKLQKAKKELENFYNEAIEKTNYDSNNNRATRRFEMILKERYPIPAMRSITTGRRIDRTKLVQESISAAPWVRSAAVYSDVLFNLTNLGIDKSSSLSALIYEMCNPYNGSPSGALKAIEMMEHLENRIKISLGQRQAAMDELDYSIADKATGSRITSGKSFRSSIELNHRFAKTFDSDILDGVGYDFLAGSRTNNVGIRRISVEQLRQRMALENNRHYTGQAAGTDTLAVSYLAPASVRTGRNVSFDLLDETFNRSLHHDAASFVLSLKPELVGKENRRLNPSVSYAASYDEDAESDLSREEVISNLVDITTLSKLGVSILDPFEYEKKNRFKVKKYDVGETELEKISSKTVFGNNVSFTTDDIEEEDLVEDEIKTKNLEFKEDLSSLSSAILSQFAFSEANLFPKNRRINSIDDIDPKNKNNVVKKMVRKRKSSAKKTKPNIAKNFRSSLPNQIKSLFLTQGEGVKRSWITQKIRINVDLFADPRSASMAYFNYEMLNRLEFFAGYERSPVTGERLLGKPIFSLLTTDALTEAISSGRTMLCRMRPYQNSVLGFSHKKRLSLPIFDEHFLISARNVTTEEEGLSPPDNLFINRLAEGTDLNEQGLKDLKSIIETSMLEDSAASEYITTTTIQQPDGPTKIGTKFGSSGRMKSMASTGASSNTVLRTLYENN
jgi:hypothetical protein